MEAQGEARLQSIQGETREPSWRKRRRLGGVERPVNTKMINSSLPSFLFIPNWNKVPRAGFHDENLILIIKDLSLSIYLYIPRVITVEN